jgi:dTDP-4-dehydrorhamnose reductase
MIHITTEYVFKGDRSSPYFENHPVEPQGVYSNTKAEGEA